MLKVSLPLTRRSPEARPVPRPVSPAPLRCEVCGALALPEPVWHLVGRPLCAACNAEAEAHTLARLQEQHEQEQLGEDYRQWLAWKEWHRAFGPCGLVFVE